MRHAANARDALWSGMSPRARSQYPGRHARLVLRGVLVASALSLLLSAAHAQDPLDAFVPTPPEAAYAERYGALLDELLASASGRAFLDALLLIDREYLYGTDRDELLRGATAGLVAALNDPYSRYVDPETVEARRTRPASDSVVVKVALGDVGYLGIASFEGDDVGGALGRALDAHLAAGARGIVLDLRGNTGGSILQGLQVLDRFIADGVLGFRRVRGVSVPIAYANPRAVNQPLVVLVDAQTASTAEIVAGALQAYGRAQLIGAVTAGKGIGQSAIELSDGAELQLVSFEWLLPGFRSIDGSGLRPDVEIDAPPGSDATPPRVSGMDDLDRDPALRAALERLRAALGDDLATPLQAPARSVTVGPTLVPLDEAALNGDDDSEEGEGDDAPEAPNHDGDEQVDGREREPGGEPVEEVDDADPAEAASLLPSGGHRHDPLVSLPALHSGHG